MSEPLDENEVVETSNFVELQRRVQALVDDASDDHLYVGIGLHNAKGALFVSDTSEINTNYLTTALSQCVKMHRANGGIGRGFVWFEKNESGVVGHWEFWTSPQDEIARLMSMTNV